MTGIPLYLFEDPGWRRFGPICSVRPTWELRLGLETLAERIARRLDLEPAGYFPRQALLPLVREAAGDPRISQLPEKGDVFLVNGRTAGIVPIEGLDPACPWSLWTDGPDVVAAKLPARVAQRWLSHPTIDPEEYSARRLLAIWGQEKTAPSVQIYESRDSLVFWPWDLLGRQAEAISASLRRVGDGSLEGEVHHRVILVEESRTHVSAGAVVDAGAIIDASRGPVIIGENAHIQPGAILIGPVVIGAHTLVKAGAKIHGPVVTGPWCKIGGEIEETLFLGYANKQHEGFLGHAIIGEWVNLGADTNNSDLKNNYSQVSIVIDGETIDTGRTFFGCLLGDHVKTAINTQLNTGTVVGIGSNLFGAGFPPKSIGAFRWGGAEGFEYYSFDKFIETARVVMERRGRSLTPAMTSLLRALHQEAVNGLL